MKKRYLIFIFFLGILLFPGFVNASEVYSILVNNVNLTDSNSSYQIGPNNSSYSMTVRVADYSIHNFYILYVEVSGTDDITASLSGGCNTSCFSSNVNVIRVGTSQGIYPRFAIVLSKGKFDCGVGSGACLIDNILTISSNKNFFLNINGAVATDTDPSLYTNYQDFQNIINNQNKNQQQTNEKLDNLNKKQQQTNEKLDNLNKNLSDDTAPDTNNTFSDIKLNTNSAISNLVLMPINFLNRVLTLSQNTCSTYSIDFGIFNSNYKLNLPCIDLQNYFGSTLWNVIDYLICFFMIYNIIMLAISAFEDITSLRDSYESLYQSKHADTGYKPKHGGD